MARCTLNEGTAGSETMIGQSARGGVSRFLAVELELRPVNERYGDIATRYGIPTTDLATDLAPLPEITDPAISGGLNYSPLPPAMMKNGWTVIDGVKIRQKGF